MVVGKVARPRSRSSAAERDHACVLVFTVLFQVVIEAGSYLQVCVVRLHGDSEPDVVQGVLVRAVDQSLRGKRGEFRERGRHLLCRALKQPAAAAGEQSVAAEQHRRVTASECQWCIHDVCHVAQRVTWYVQRACLDKVLQSFIEGGRDAR